MKYTMEELVALYDEDMDNLHSDWDRTYPTTDWQTETRDVLKSLIPQEIKVMRSAFGNVREACPRCDASIMGQSPNFCYMCGQPFKKEEIK